MIRYGRPPGPWAVGLVLGLGCNHGSPAAPRAGAPAADAAPSFDGVVVYATGATTSVMQSFFEFLPEANARVKTSADPATAAAGDTSASLRVAIATDLTCGECYRITVSGAAYEVHGETRSARSTAWPSCSKRRA